MAYMNQERKAKIAANLKKVVPAGWKYSLAVRNHSTIVMNISAAPVNLIAAFKPSKYFDPETATHADVNPYWFREHFANEEVLKAFEKIFAALNDGNHDRSDIQTDYFDVGWYVDVNIGRWDKPFQYLAPVQEAA